MTRPVVRIARGALAGAFFLAYGAVGIASFPLLLCIAWSKRAVRAVVRAYYRCIVYMLAACGLVRVKFSRPVSGVRGRIVVMNHLSLLDVLVLFAHLPDSTCIVKAAAMRNPFLAAAARIVFLSNGDDPARTIAAAAALLANGVNVIIFPEGTRTPKDSPSRKLHRGAARLALATGAKVQPIHLELDPPVFARGQPLVDAGDHTIWYSMEVRDEIVPSGPADRHGAIALTERIGKAIL